ncbi:MAG: DUF1844 domain-containing protein [bacterium]|nr:MAG: DUF1844 domain-containing protein [bacterium]
MSDADNSDKSFKVQDRRTSSGSKGDRDPGAEEQPASAPEKEAGGEEARSPRGAGTGGVPQVDFSTFIFSLFSSALIQLGDMADPLTGKMEKNLNSAKQTIDIVDILREKTKGNLTEEEDNLLKNAAAELKWKYLDAVKKKA